MVSLARKVILRRQAARAAEVARTAARSGRTGQIVRSSIAVGDDDYMLDQVAGQTVETADGLANQVEGVALLDEGVDADLGSVLDYGSAADALTDFESVADLGDEFERAVEGGEAAHTAHMLAIETAGNVDEALDAANQAAADALAAAQASADAQARVSDLTAQLVNKVVNPGFENGGTGWVAGAEPLSEDLVVQGEGIAGGAAVNVVPVGAVAQETQLPVALGQTWRVSFWYKGTPSVVQVMVVLLKADGSLATLITTPAMTDAATDFVRYSAEVEITHSEAVVAGFGVVGASATNEPVWIDNVAVEDITELKAAMVEAEAVRYLAEGLYQAIPSETAPTSSPSGPLKQGDMWFVIGAEGSEVEGKFVGVQVWDGAQWVPREMLADSVLVVSPDGNVRIADGKVTAQSLTADAIDGKTITGAIVRGGLVEQTAVTGSGTISIPITETNYPEVFASPSDLIVSTQVPASAVGSTVSASSPLTHSFIVSLPDYLKGVTTQIRLWLRSPTTRTVTANAHNNAATATTFNLTANTWTQSPYITLPPNSDGTLILNGAANVLATGVMVLVPQLTATAQLATKEGAAGLFLERNGSGVAELTDKGLTLNTIGGGSAVEITSSGFTFSSSGSGHYHLHSSSRVTVGPEADGQLMLFADSIYSTANHYFRGSVNLAGRVTTSGNVFNLKSTLDAWTSAIDGTHAWVTSEGREYVRAGGAWRKLTDAARETDGLVNLPGSSASGITDSVSNYEIRGGIVFITLSVSGNIPVGSAIDLWSGVPAFLRPATNRMDAAFMGGGYSTVAWARADGTIAIANQTGATRSTAQFTLKYPLV